jgi:type II secretory pathway pseudopilin PulG
MVIRTRRNNSDGLGFTLVELLLTVALLLALLAAVIFNFQSAQRGTDLEEGARQMQALIRFAGAQAANIGKAVQLRFGENTTSSSSSGTNSVSDVSTNSTDAKKAVNDFASIEDLEHWGTKLRVVYEADPVLQPGVFVDLPEASSFVQAIGDRVRIDSVRWPERPLNQATNELAVAPQTTTANAVTFYPDGSSDTIDIVLVSKEREDFREMILHVDGVTGNVRAELKSGDDLVPIEWMDDPNSSDKKQSAPTATASSEPKPEAATQPPPMPEDPAFEQPEKNKTETTRTNAFDDFP